MRNIWIKEDFIEIIEIKVEYFDDGLWWESVLFLKLVMVRLFRFFFICNLRLILDLVSFFVVINCCEVSLVVVFVNFK